jgi:hypothetical protein
MNIRSVLLLLWAPFAAAPAFALDVEQQRIERERIRSERAQVEAAFVEREQGCRQRFVVTSCVDAARSERRQALEDLRRQQEVLDAEQRKQRAAQRVEAIRSKVSGDDTRRREAVLQERGKRKQRAQLVDRSAQGGHAASAAAAPAASASSADEQERRADYERRQQEARQHRADVQRRQADKAPRGSRAKPLPVPASVPPPAR